MINQHNLHPVLARILTYLMMAVMLVVFVFGLFIFTYIFIFMLILGGILFAIGYVRMKFFKPKPTAKTTVEIKIGRIIEHDKKNE